VKRYEDSRVFGREELAIFLRAVDRNLTTPARIVIIGGSAAALHEGASTTNDIDTYNKLPAAVEAAVAAAVGETGLAIPVGISVVADYPWNFQDRLERRYPELEHLEVLVLERHDLFLSKALRAYDNDEIQLRAMHRARPFDYDVLVDRFQSEMAQVVGTPSVVCDNFLDMIRAVFGELKRIDASKKLASWPKRPRQ
jgi:hypothetical protein